MPITVVKDLPAVHKLAEENIFVMDSVRAETQAIRPLEILLVNLTRRGDMNSPVLVGGGRVFGPKPRDYYFKLNKKVKALARKSALAYKAQNNAIIVVEDFNFEAPKTKDFVVMTKNLKVSDKKLLVVLPEANKNVYLSARNVKGANVQTISGLNTYRVLDAGVVVFAESALSAIDNILM